MLYLVVVDLCEGMDAMAGKNATLCPDHGLVKVALAVNEYGSHFDHPRFEPIRNVRWTPRSPIMKFEFPLHLRQEHEALHERLRLATQAAGELGEAARTVARLMHPHFVKEDSIALPPLGLLVAMARGEATPEMALVLVLTDQLEAGLPEMLA